MNAALAQRQIALAGLALLAGIVALALGSQKQSLERAEAPGLDPGAGRRLVPGDRHVARADLRAVAPGRRLRQRRRAAERRRRRECDAAVREHDLHPVRGQAGADEGDRARLVDRRGRFRDSASTRPRARPRRATSSSAGDTHAKLALLDPVRGLRRTCRTNTHAQGACVRLGGTPKPAGHPPGLPGSHQA